VASVLIPFDDLMGPWRQEARCHDTPKNFFYPDASERNGSVIRAFCAACPVIGPCAEWGIKHESDGWWGGLSASDRTAARARRGITVQGPGHV
jgi:hypothetical protein